MLDFTAELAAFVPCTCPPHALDLCEHATPCRNRAPHDLGHWCDACLHDLCRDLADSDECCPTDWVDESLTILADAIQAQLCPSCRVVALTTIAEYRTLPKAYRTGIDGNVFAVPVRD